MIRIIFTKGEPIEITLYQSGNSSDPRLHDEHDNRYSLTDEGNRAVIRRVAEVEGISRHLADSHGDTVRVSGQELGMPEVARITFKPSLERFIAR